MDKTSAVPAFYELSRRQKNYIKLKRAGDVLFSALALVLLLIPFGLIALGQKLDAPEAPVLFRQKRVGKDGMLFSMTKFRSLRPTADPNRPSAEAEAALSAWGRFLRRSSLDELPQLWQVFRGRMSLVGPRPLIPEEVSIHEGRRAAGVYQLRPGLTGWAQVNGRDRLTAGEKIAYDYAYLKALSLCFDLKILLRTVICVLRRENIR